MDEYHSQEQVAIVCQLRVNVLSTNISHKEAVSKRERGSIHRPSVLRQRRQQKKHGWAIVSNGEKVRTKKHKSKGQNHVCRLMEHRSTDLRSSIADSIS